MDSVFYRMRRRIWHARPGLVIPLMWHSDLLTAPLDSACVSAWMTDVKTLAEPKHVHDCIAPTRCFSNLLWFTDTVGTHVMIKSPVIKWLSQPNTYWRNWSNCFVCHPLCRWPGATKLSFLCPWLFRKSRQNWKLSLSLPDLKMPVQQFLLHLFHLFTAPPPNLKSRICGFVMYACSEMAQRRKQRT